ncbi:hypothetical protein [Mucilaginibacter kameinonensis]|uniref:hypothetical protein n=1 Tax=Mucilaginibacter kameinonensis TaxID=452286 RepID=UPI000EF778DA|nr:hypothetical protein [Mucilaginibacter kameinonensis]
MEDHYDGDGITPDEKLNHGTGIKTFMAMSWKKTNWIITEVWCWINEVLKETLREVISKKLIDNMLVYLIYALLICSISYAGFQLFVDIQGKFLTIPDEHEFPFILQFSEKLFLYFLPVFILFGILNYYDLEWSRLINKANKPNPNAEKYLNVSKKLFFSSLLSYTSLKIIEKLFFKESGEHLDPLEMLYIGVFFVILLLFVISQHKHKEEPN